MIAVSVTWNNGQGPAEFAPGSQQTAVFRIQNQHGVPVTLFVKAQVQGASDGSTVGESPPALLQPGATQNFYVTMTMPSRPGSYVLYAEVYANGVIQGNSTQPYGPVTIRTATTPPPPGGGTPPPPPGSGGGGFSLGDTIYNFFHTDPVGASIAIGAAAFIGYKFLTRNG